MGAYYNIITCYELCCISSDMSGGSGKTSVAGFRFPFSNASRIADSLWPPRLVLINTALRVLCKIQRLFLRISSKWYKQCNNIAVISNFIDCINYFAI